MMYRKIDYCIALVSLISVISQIPAIYNNSYLNNLTSLSWVLLAILALSSSKFKITYSKIIFLPILFDLYCVICSIVTNNNYFTANLFRPINMSAFIFIVGLIIGEQFNLASFILFSKVYIIGVAITSLIIYIQYYRGQNIGNIGYLYGGKNSLSCLVLISIIISFLGKEYLFDTKIKKTILNFLILLNIIFLFILRSRTTIICLIIFLIWYLCLPSTSIIIKVFWSVIIIIGVLAIWENEQLADFLIVDILMNGKDITDIDSITSGRMSHWEIFAELFPSYRYLGNGGYYLESFPLALLLSFGIIGAIPVFAFMISPLISSIKGLLIGNKDRVLSLIIFVVSITLMLNGLAEEQSPFGPGVKCFVLWFFYGLYYGYNENTYNQLE